MGGRAGVQRQGPLAALRGHARPPVGVQMVERLARHPGGEAFVEPQVVPPVHGDQVAEPLVRHLMGDGRRHVLAVFLGRQPGIDQQGALEVHDGPPVLHRREAARSRRRDEVQLGQRIGDAEVVVVVGENRGGLVQGIGRLGRLAAGDDHADVDAIDLAADPLEVPDRQEHQVGRHLRGGLEDGALQAAGERLHAGDRRVGNRHLAGGRHHAQLEAGLGRRVVPAGREPARIGVLELGDQDPLGTARRGVVQVEQPGGKAVDHAGVVDLHGMLARGQGMARAQGDGLAGGVEPDLRRGAVDRGVLDLQVEGIQRHRRDLLARLHLDGLGSGEGQLLRVRRDIDAVADRLNGQGQPERRPGLSGRSLDRGGRLRRRGPRAAEEDKGECAEREGKPGHGESIAPSGAKVSMSKTATAGRPI